MENYKRLNQEFWNYVEQKKENSPKFQRIYNALDKDCLSGIIMDEGKLTFYIEPCSAPMYVKEEIKRWGKNVLNLMYVG